MHIETVDTVEGFNRIRENWDAVYETDPEAQFFLSWTWLSKWFRQIEGQWFILAAKQQADASNYVAFFPLRLRTKMRAKGGGFYNEINMAGNYAADYTGLICAPEFQDQAIPVFAKYLKTLNWTRLHLENFRASKERIHLLLQHYSSKTFETKESDRINEKDNINNCICPIVRLPGDWDTYLNNYMSANTRQRARRFLRQVENSSEFRITHAGGDTFDRDLKILLTFWAKKWGARKGNNLQTILDTNYTMLTRCAERKSVFMPILWQGERPLGALASFMDTKKRSLLFFMGARDETFNNPPPGFALHAYSIRYAINNGFTSYDFLRGNETYKYSFGPEEHRIKCIDVSTKNGRNLGNKLDSRSVPYVLHRANKLHESGKLVEAERGYRQILDIEPRNPTALYCFAQLMEVKGKTGAAKRAFQELIAIKPNSDKAWFGFARTLLARGKFSEAADAYHEVIKRRPEHFAAYYNLGTALLKLAKYDEALAAFETALELQPDYAKGHAIWANVLAMVAKASPHLGAHFAMLNANLADKMRARGQLVFAANCYRQAINMKSDLVAAHYGLGQIFQAQGNIEGASQSYRKVLELEPRNRDVLALLPELSSPQINVGLLAYVPVGAATL